MTSADEPEQESTWQAFYERLRAFLMTIGNEGIGEADDCWVDDDNIGTRQQKVYIGNLRLLRPETILALQALVGEYPGWEIMVAIAVPGPGEAWPEMGMTIRPHEIIDGLQREYFPPEYRDLHYPGSRPGTELD